MNVRTSKRFIFSIGLALVLGACNGAVDQGGEVGAELTAAEGGRLPAPEQDAIAALIKTWQPDALVIGVPRHPDGAPHEMTAKAQTFGRRVAGRYHLPVFEVDERYTSVEAEAEGAHDVDAAAAALILEQFFREHP